ncbi:MAG TPA: hypothetical protein DGT21_21760 [Armatimonadetes bacterium]|nr:hypothetical protein [Armatimonadota bacterium]
MSSPVVGPAQSGLWGDVDGNGLPGVADAIGILRMVVGLDPYNPSADTDQDGAATVSDAIAVLRCVVGFDPWPIGGGSLSVTLTADPEFIVPGGSSTLTWVSTGATAVSASENFEPNAVSGSLQVTPASTTTYSITVTDGQGGIATDTATVTVYDGAIAFDLDPLTAGIQSTANLRVGNQLVVDIVASGVTDLSGFSVGMTYNTSRLQTVTVGDISQGSFLGSAGGNALFFTNFPSAGAIEIVSALQSPAALTAPDGSGVLASIVFTGRSAGAAALAFSLTVGSGTRYSHPGTAAFGTPQFADATITVSN